MQLEILSSQPSSPSHPVPVVFVHGAWHGAWCWTEHFLPYFAERGYEAHALSLRGHGGSPGRERLRWTSLAEYVADVASVLEGLPRAPVLVGHSMGGAVVQQFLETHTLPGAVLLASVPPAGALRAALRVARRHPLQFAKANLTLSLYPLIDTPRLAREAFWGASMAPQLVERYFPQLQDEAYRAFLDMIAFGLRRRPKVTTPVLVMGAADDMIFTPAEARATARAYSTEAVIFPDMAHDMMLEAHWRLVADRIIGWIGDHAPDHSANHSRVA
jgi:pimeloyl-ACP methyl ester carboxylesterase